MKKTVRAVLIGVLLLSLLACGFPFELLQDIQEPAATPTVAAGIPPQDGWLTYTNTHYGFEVQYPVEAILYETTEYSAMIQVPIEPNTNLVEKYLDILAQEGISPCQGAMTDDGSGEEPAQVTIRGVDFLRETGGDAGAGNYYEFTSYSTQRNGMCVSLTFILHSLNRDFFENPPAVFDAQAETVVFDEMLETFRWLDP